MKNIKKMLAVFLTVALLFCSVPIMTAFAAAPTIPKLSTEDRSVLASIERRLAYKTVPAGVDMNTSTLYRMQYQFPKTVSVTGEIIDKTEYFEMDVYVSVDLPEDTDAKMWISNYSNRNSVRGYIPMNSFSLKAGWNHIVADVTAIEGINGFNFKTSDEINYVYWEGVLSKDNPVEIAYGNIAFTYKEHPEDVPAPEYTQKVIKSTTSDLKGEKDETAGDGFFAAETYYDAFADMAGNPFNLTVGENLEFSIFTDTADSFDIALGSGNEFLDSLSKTKNITLKIGWNFIVLPITDEFKTAVDVSSDYDPTAVSGIVIKGAKGGYIRLTNIALTREAPLAEDTYENELIDYSETITEKTWAGSQEGDIYSSNNNQDRLFISLGKTIDITEADSVEFDIYVSAKMQDLTMWICNDFDATGRIAYIVPFSGAKIGWNHFVINLSAFSATDGDMDKTNWTGIFFGGDPNAAGVELTVKLTNIGASKTCPDMHNTYIPVDDHPLEGVQSVGTSTTVPAGADLYPTYQMWKQGFNMDVSKAEYIELDIYVSNDTENTLSMWTATDGAADRGRYTIPILKKGWNHVVIDLALDLAWSNGSWSKDTFKTWSGFFFQGTPSQTSEVTFKFANIAVTTDEYLYNAPHTVYIPVDEPLSGAQKLGTPSTVPVGAGLYPTYQMWKQGFNMDVSKAEYIELDIYASEATENEIGIWTATDGTVDRAKYRIPILEKGWNHVVVDLAKDLLTSNGSWSRAAFTTWRGFFFEGTPSTTNTVTFKVANLTATKFPPDPANEHTAIFDCTEIYSNRDYAEGSFDTGYMEFADSLNFNKADNVEFHIYIQTNITDDITVTIKGARSSSTATAVISPEKYALKAGWQHIVLPISEFTLGDGMSLGAVKSIAFSGSFDTEKGEIFKFAAANLALTVIESAKEEMTYNGVVLSKYEAYENEIIPAAEDLANTLTPISLDPVTLPTKVDLDSVDYIEMNLYVTSKCDLTFKFNSTDLAEDTIYEEADAYYTLKDLKYGWNKICIPKESLIANSWFNPSAVNYLYFSGVPAAAYDVTLTVEDLALTSATRTAAVIAGDYNDDGAVDIRDVIRTRKYQLEGENEWFLNAAEVDGAQNGVIDSLDIVALKKLLFTVF